MSKPSHREKILTEGLRVVHERGFAGASVRDIVQAAGVPQGSFTNHFASKEAFGLEILEIYAARGRAMAEATLVNDALPPLERLEAWVNGTITKLTENGMRKGCLIGNLTGETSEHTEAMRARLVEMFSQATRAIAHCLRAAVQAGELPVSLDCDEMAGFIFSSLQGANLMAKAQRSSVPLQRFKNILFSTVLR
jgi:TetR/AcrR family transcriptional regulator, transcriptional repressor for nem operon